MKRLAAILVGVTAATGAIAPVATAAPSRSVYGAVLVLNAGAAGSDAQLAAQLRAGRRFVAHRDADIPVGVVSADAGGVTILTPPTTDRRALTDALRSANPTAGSGNTGSDRGIKSRDVAAGLLRNAGMPQGAIVSLPDYAGANGAARVDALTTQVNLAATVAQRANASFAPHASGNAGKGTNPFVRIVLALAAAMILIGGLRPLTRLRSGSAVRRRVTDFSERAEVVEAGVEFSGPESDVQRRSPLTERLERLDDTLELAQLEISARRLVAFTAAGTAFVAVVASAIVGSPLPALAAVAIVPLAVRAYVKFELGRQRRRFGDQLADQLQAMAVALRSGYSFSAAVAGLLEDAPEPSRTEFGRLVADERVGVPFEEAFAELVRRMENRDLEQVALVAVLQRETGGNGAEALDRVVESLRSRLEVRRLVNSLTAQGRMSRWVLTAMPIGLGAFLTMISPEYMHPLYTTATGRLALILAVLLMATGSFAMKKMIEIELEVMLILLSLLLGAFAVAMARRATTMPRVRVESTLASIESDYSYDDSVADSNEPRQSLVARIGSRVIGRIGSAQLEAERHQLLQAGMHGVTAEQMTGYRVIAAVAIPVLMLQLAISNGKPAMAVLLVGIGAVVGWRAPRIFVERRAKTRMRVIDRAMPELVDLLVVGVESGIGFNGAINAAAERIRGPLADELALMLREQGLGISLPEALERMLERADTGSVRIFVRTIVHGEKLGTPVANVLRSLASEMRKRQRADAEEQANKAPVKILFPLVFLIFPSIFIVLLTPAAIQLVNGLGSQL